MVRSDLSYVQAFFQSLNKEQKDNFVKLFKGDKCEDAARFIDALLMDQKVTVDKVLTIIEQVWNLSEGSLRSQSRKEEIVMARAHYYKIMTLYTNLSYEAITEQVDKTHSTLCHALNTSWPNYLNSKWANTFKINLSLIKSRVVHEVFNQTSINEPQTY